MKKILVMIDSLRCGGAEKSLTSLLPFLANRNYKITLVVMSGGGSFERFVPCSIRLEKFPYSPKLIDRIKLSVALRIPSNKKSHGSEVYWEKVGRKFPSLNEEYDVAIAYQQGFPTFYIAEKVKAKKKYCWINADIKSVGYSSSFCQPLYAKYDKVIAVSETLREKIVYPDFVKDINKIITVRDIQNENLIRELSKEYIPFSKASSTIEITSVGRLVKLKGFDLAIDAAKILRDRGVPFKWHIVGGGIEYTHLQARIEGENLQDQVILEGERVNPYPFIADCDIYVQTSLYEGFGMTIGEAKILSKPIISTDFSVVFNQLTNGKTGLIVGKNGEEIAKAIERLINDSELRNRLVEKVSNERNLTAETESIKVIELIES